MVGPSLLCVIGYFGWLYYGAHKLDMAYYGLKKENIHITQQPPWLKKTNVLDEVFSESSLASQSLLDRKTPELLARVFNAHPAVKKTLRVEPMAGGVVINIEYRTPVAMVNCKGNAVDNGKAGFLPVDVEGILLGVENFTSSDIPQFIAIFADVNALESHGKEGKPFGDPRVEQAAQLCQLLVPLREMARITAVFVYPAQFAGKTKWLLEIQTSGGPRFKWGSCPGLEGLGEPLAETKLNRIKSIANDNKQWKVGEIDLTSSSQNPSSQASFPLK